MVTPVSPRFGAVHFFNKAAIPVYKRGDNVTGTDKGLRNLVRNYGDGAKFIEVDPRVLVVDTGEEAPGDYKNIDRLLTQFGGDMRNNTNTANNHYAIGGTRLTPDKLQEGVRILMDYKA